MKSTLGSCTNTGLRQLLLRSSNSRGDQVDSGSPAAVVGHRAVLRIRSPHRDLHRTPRLKTLYAMCNCANSHNPVLAKRAENANSLFFVVRDAPTVSNVITACACRSHCGRVVNGGTLLAELSEKQGISIDRNDVNYAVLRPD